MIEILPADLAAAASYWGNDNPPLELQREFARHRIEAIAAIGPSEYERGFQAAKRQAELLIEDTSCVSAGNFNCYSAEWAGYAQAISDCHLAISNMEPVK